MGTVTTPSSDQRAQELHALADVLVRSVAFDGNRAVPAGFLKVAQALSDVVRIDAAADGHFAASNAGLFSRIAAASDGLTSLMCVVTYLRNRFKYSSGSKPAI